MLDPAKVKIGHDCEPLGVGESAIVLPHFQRVHKTGFLRRRRGSNGLCDKSPFLSSYLIGKCDRTSSNRYVLNILFRYTFPFV